MPAATTTAHQASSDGSQQPIDPRWRATPGRLISRGSPGERLVLIVLLVLLGLLIVVPVAMMFYGAVRTAPIGDDARFTTHAIQQVYTTVPYLRSLGGTLLLALVVATLATGIGSIFAWLMHRTDMPGRRWLEILVMSPLFLSPFVGAVAWITLAAPRSGIINVAARQLFGSEGTLLNIMTIRGIVFVLTLYYVPYAMLFMSASLKNMDPSLEEASYINGAGEWYTLRSVTFPLARPAMTASFFFIGVLAMGVFSVPGILGAQLDFTPLAVLIQRSAGSYPSDYATAAALGTMLFLFTIVGVWLYRRSLRRSSRYVTVTARGFRPRRTSLGRLRYLGSFACLLYGLLAVVLPYSALSLVSLTPYVMTDLTRIEFTLDNITNVLGTRGILEALQNTLIVAVLSSAACVLLGLVTAYVVHRNRTSGRGLLEYLGTMPIAIPGIVFATGIVWTYIRTPLYATLATLVLAFTASYLPHTLRLTGNGLLQIDPVLEEASIVNGASRTHTLRRITLPLSKPALLSGWILVFIFTVREINTAILLISPRSNILSVLTWDLVQDGRIANGAVVGIFQTLLLIGGVAVARFVFKVKLSSV